MTDEEFAAAAVHVTGFADGHPVSCWVCIASTVTTTWSRSNRPRRSRAARTLLKVLDLQDVVVTVDAMHTQHDTAELIVAGGGDYVFTVKSNQPSLYAACKNLPWAKISSHSLVSTTHGRRARRTIKVLAAPAWIAFSHATQVAQIRRTVTRTGRRSVEVVYIITSADHRTAPPATLASWVRRHWGIENSPRWVRDVGSPGAPWGRSWPALWLMVWGLETPWLWPALLGVEKTSVSDRCAASVGWSAPVIVAAS